ncbi:MAG: SRPBCC family protein [Terriglobales bacterium]
MLPRVEYSVTARATPEELWGAFSNLSRLLGRGIYSEAAWTEGLPWQTGSRLRYVVVHPLQATVTAVVTLSEPPSKVGFLNHSLGITAQQLVTFIRLSPNTTRVVMTMEFVGESTSFVPLDVAEALRFFTHDTLDSMLAQYAENQQSR